VPEVWELLCDPARSPEWSEEVTAVTGAPARIERGMTVEMTSRGPLGIKATTPFRVTEFADMHEIKMQCQVSGYYSHWILTEAQGGTFTELELGFEPLDHKVPIQARAMAALHTKSYLRRTVDRLLDGLRNAVSRDRAGAS
jgi:Polyketide cyclase / dehydrase and lipid transport